MIWSVRGRIGPRVGRASGVAVASAIRVAVSAVASATWVADESGVDVSGKDFCEWLVAPTGESNVGLDRGVPHAEIDTISPKTIMH